MIGRQDKETTPPILSRLFGLEGEVAAVVGGAGRIGSTLCHALAAAGARVAIVDLDSTAAESLAADINEKRCCGEAIAISCDATNHTELDAAINRIESELGGAGVLVNSAQYRGGGFYSSAPEEYEHEAWRKIMDVNLTGVFQTCQAFGRRMIERRRGAIINLSSTYGVVSPDPRVYGDSGVNSPPAYGAAKAGVIQLTRYLAVHWREHNIRVNCLVPGGVFDNQDAEFVREYEHRTPLGRMASTEDYQGAVIFLASAASEYMTGSVMTVDGGWTAW